MPLLINRLRRGGRTAAVTFALAAAALSGTTLSGTAMAEPARIPTDQGAIVERLQKAALAGSGAFEIVESITVEVGPRLVGTPADKAMVDWSVNRLKGMGFDKVWTEPVEVDGWIRGEERAAVTAPWPQPLVITALGGTVPTQAGGIEAEIAYFDHYDDLLAAAPGSLTGKIAFVNQPTIVTQDGSGYGHAVRMRGSGAVEAAKRGAVGLLIRSVGTHAHRMPHTGLMQYQEGVAKIPAAALSVADAEQLTRLVRRGQSVRVSLALTPTAPGKVVSHNVIAELTGAQAPEEIVLLGAHHDSWDLGTGALDDGAGIGIVLSAARLIKDLPERPRRTIRIVLFAAEEVGLVGARAYAARHKDSLESHIIGTEADFGAGPVYAFATRIHPDTKPAADVIQRHLAPLGIIPNRELASGGPDMIPLRQAGMPVVDLLKDGYDYFAVHHTANDTLDQVDPRKLDQSVAAYATFTWLVAQGTGSFRPIPQE
ncbi:MAG: hypothetical protein RLY86_4250 [Pseudomonadota bacterium]